MTQPTPYVRDYSFGTFSAQSPSAQIPGAKLDSQFDAISKTLATLLFNLQFVQRDDLRLANKSVGIDQLDNTLSAGLVQISARTPDRYIDPRDMPGWLPIPGADNTHAMQLAFTLSAITGTVIAPAGNLKVYIAGTLDPAFGVLRPPMISYNRNQTDPTLRGFVLLNVGDSALFTPSAGGFTIENTIIFDPLQPGVGPTPVARPPVFLITGAIQVTDVTFANNVVPNCYDFFKTANGAIIGDYRIRDNRIFAIRHNFIFRSSSPEALLVTNNMFTPGVWQSVAIFANNGMLAKWRAKNGHYVDVGLAGISVDGFKSSGNYIFAAAVGFSIVAGGVTVCTSVGDNFDQVAALLGTAGEGTIDISITAGKYYGGTFGDSTVVADANSLTGSGLHEVVIAMSVGTTTGTWISTYSTMTGGGRVLDRSDVFFTGAAQTNSDLAPAGIFHALGTYDK